MTRFLLLLAVMMQMAPPRARAAVDPENPLKRRVASIYISETFLNEQLKARSAKAQLVKDLKLELDPKSDVMFLRGKIQVPLEELKAVNVDKELSEFRFQVTIKPQVSKHGHLVLEFPLSETYFYPANSKHPDRDRVIIPVQLMSLALASTRGYLAALSGDFSTFDRKSEKIKALLKNANRSISEEKNPDALAELKNDKKSLELQLEAVPVERAQMESTSKSLSNVLSFTGEKELNLNEEISAHKNALTLKIKLGKIVPYLKDVELGGIRVSHDKKDGNGEDYLVIDVASQLEEMPPAPTKGPRTPRIGMKIPPSLLMRLNQNVFNSKAIVAAQKEKLGSDIRDFEVTMKDDGLHVSGKWHKFFLNIPFDTTVDFVTTEPDIFEVRLRELSVEGVDFKFLTKYALDAIKERLDKALTGICEFKYIGEGKDESEVLQVKVQPKNLVPAFPDLHLVAVDVSNREFMLKIGHTE